MTDTPLPPDEALESPYEFLRYIEENGDEKLALYLAYLLEDFYSPDKSFVDSDRYYNIDEIKEPPLDISSMIDLAVLFGQTWERYDPRPESPNPEEISTRVLKTEGGYLSESDFRDFVDELFPQIDESEVDEAWDLYSQR